MNKVDYICLWL